MFLHYIIFGLFLSTKGGGFPCFSENFDIVIDGLTGKDNIMEKVQMGD
jgi:hypothetical protein